MWVAWWALAFGFCTAVFRGAGAALDRRADRRWARMVRERERRELRRKTWATMARLGGW